MLMIRLQRVGRVHEPVFRLVLTESQNSSKSGKFHEIIGNFDARRGEKAEFKNDRIKYWMSKGAKLSDTVHNILIERGVITGKKINVLPKKTVKKIEELKDGKIEKLGTKEEEKKDEVKEEKIEEKAEEAAPAESTEEVVA
jgi:small subunit ribosomal protein S16